MESILDYTMNPANLLELDEEQFKVQPVSNIDCDGMCCSDCTVQDCPAIKPYNKIHN